MRALTIATIVSVVTAISTCNPTTQLNCPADPGLGTLIRQDFDEGAGDRFEVLDKAGEVKFDSTNGMLMTMKKRGDNPTIQLDFYILFGRVEVVLKAAKGTGIISLFYLQLDDLDEIDIELFGGDSYEFQSNYFSKGNTKTYDRGQYHPTLPLPVDNFHTYTIDWTPDALTWSLDGNVVRTLPSDNPQGYPQTPMQIIAGVWAGGDPDNAQGTIEWAGGLTDFSEAPFTMNIRLIVVSDYSLGSKYTYSDQSGTWKSITLDKGTPNDPEEKAQKEWAQLVDDKPLPQTLDKILSSSSSTQSQSQPSTEQSTGSSGSSSDSDSSTSESHIESSGGSLVFIDAGPNSDNSDSTSDSLSPTDDSQDIKSDDIVGISTIGMVNPTAYVLPNFVGQQGAQTQGQIQLLTTGITVSYNGDIVLNSVNDVPERTTLLQSVSISNFAHRTASSIFSILFLLASLSI